MAYISCASVKMNCTIVNDESWHDISKNYYWRVIDDCTFVIITGPCEDKEVALEISKNMHINLLKELISTDYSIDIVSGLTEISPYSYQFGSPGFGVIPTDLSVEDFMKNNTINTNFNLNCNVEYYIDFNKIQNNYANISDNIHELYIDIASASNVYGYNLKMEIYCTVLERIATHSKKSDEVLSEINQLIEHVKHSGISEGEKVQLINYLENGKSQSNKQCCIELVTEYGKSEYNGIKAIEIIAEAYQLRSKVAHKRELFPPKIKSSMHMKELVLDVLEKYCQTQQIENPFV